MNKHYITNAMKKRFIIILLCLVSGLFSCTQTNSSRKKSEGKTMTTEVNSNYYVENIFYNPYKKVEKKDSETNIWSKEKNNSKPKTKILDDCELAEKIHSNRGLFSSSKKLNEYIENINTNNVIYLVENYKRWYGKSIFNEIMSNVFISSKTRANAVKHIKDMLMQAMKRSSTYTEDYDKLIDGHIDYEKNKCGRMKSKDIDEDLRALFDRHKQTRSGNNKLIPANGKIDAGFNQGYVMDCWLLSAIKSVSINPKGREMLNDLISLDDKGNVTVQLKGVKRTYTISKEELKGANEFAQGDLDIRAIELAVNKYLHEIGDHGGNKNNEAKINSSRYDIYSGMYRMSTPYYILFGKTLVDDSKTNKETIEKIKSGEYSTVVLSYNNCQPQEGYMKHHIYAVTGADDKYVYLSDPYSPDIKCSITHSNFINFFNVSHSAKLSN